MVVKRMIINGLFYLVALYGHYQGQAWSFWMIFVVAVLQYVNTECWIEQKFELYVTMKKMRNEIHRLQYKED